MSACLNVHLSLQNIVTASHANDGDVKHLRDALSMIDALGSKLPLYGEAQSLCSRLDAEVWACGRVRIYLL